MATTILTGPLGLFDADTRDKASPQRILYLANFGQPAFPSGTSLVNGTAATNLLLKRKQVATARAQIADAPDFIVEATTTAAETGAVCELIARGVTFPANSERLVNVDFYVAGNATDETGWARHTALVSGGTTPIVRVVTVPASTPVQVGGNTLSGVAAAGFTATPAVTVTAGSGTLTVNVVSAEAENLNWKVFIRLGKLVPLRVPAS